MPVAVLYPFALLGALTLFAFAGLLLLIVLVRLGNRRATHRKMRSDDSPAKPTSIA